MTKDAQQHPSTKTSRTLMKVTSLEEKTPVQAICVDETIPITACINELANRIDRELAEQSATRDLLENLVSSVANIK